MKHPLKKSKPQLIKKISVETLSTIAPPDLQPTGIDDFDTLLNGGIPSGSNVLLAGGSGTGKTILSLQWLFAGYDKYGESGLYISLTEPVNKMLSNAKKFSFYQEKQVGPLQVYFTDMRGIIEGMNLESKDISFGDIDQITSTLKILVSQSKAKRVVIDSFTALAYLLKEKDKIRDFVFKLGALLSQTDANVLLISEVPKDGYSVFGIEEFIADGIIKLTPIRSRGEIVRQLEIVKMRGSSYESAPTTFRITSGGILFFPHLNRHLTYPVSDVRVPIGTAGLDEMIAGGVFTGSSTLLSGPSGTGKTILGLQFLTAGLKRGEKCLMISFEESENQLIQVAKSFGWDLEAWKKTGQLVFMCSYPEEYYLEEHIGRIKQQLDTFSAQRVLVDSLSAVGTAYTDESLPDFTSRIVAHFKQIGITSVFTLASESLLGATSITNANLSTLYDNIILLRYIEMQAELKHLLLILKMRGTPHDKKLRELSFSPEGIKVTLPFTGLEGTLSGETRQISATAEEQFRSLLLEILGPAGEEVFQTEKAKGLSHDHIETILKDFANQSIISKRRKEELLQTLHQVTN